MRGNEGRDGRDGRKLVYIDMAYTLGGVKARGFESFYIARESHGYFDHVWGVHPLADLGGSKAESIVETDFSPRQTVIEGVSREHPRWPRWAAPFDFLLAQRKLLARLDSVMREHKVDLVMCTDPLYGGLLGAYLKWRHKVPLVIAVFGNYELNYRTSGTLIMPRLFPFYALQAWVTRRVLRYADKVVATNQDNLAYTVSAGAAEERTAQIPVSRYVQAAHLRPPEKRTGFDETRLRRGIPESDRYMIMISRLSAIKYADEGIRAMRVAIDHCPDAIGLVAGDGPLRGELEALVRSWGLEKQILFLGDVDQVTLSELSPRCVNISPLTGMALLEAGLAGAPAVAYDADWQPEFVRDGVSGYIVPLHDHQAMGEKAAQLLQDPERRKAFGAAMRDTAFAIADPERVARVERDIYDSLFTSAGDPGER